MILPNVSVGIGFNYLSGGITGPFESAALSAGSYTIGVSGSPEIGLLWNTKSLDFKARISKSILVITPYLGIGASYAWSEAGYEVKAKNVNYSDKNGIADYLKAKGLESMDFDNSGFSSMVNRNAFCLRGFGGLSFNLTIIRLDLTGLYNFFDGNYGASLGLRVQL